MGERLPSTATYTSWISIGDRSETEGKWMLFYETAAEADDAWRVASRMFAKDQLPGVQRIVASTVKGARPGGNYVQLVYPIDDESAAQVGELIMERMDYTSSTGTLKYKHPTTPLNLECPRPGTMPVMQDAKVFCFDLETDGLLDKTRSNHHDLRMTAGVGIDHQGTRHDFVLLPGMDDEQHQKVLTDLAIQMDAADVIVIYNGRWFDLQILANYYSGDHIARWTQKLRDPFEYARRILGEWPKLNAMLTANGIDVKTADGIEAVAWWTEGKYDQVLEYCAADVSKLRDLVMMGNVLRCPAKRQPDKMFDLPWHDFPMCVAAKPVVV